MNQESPALAVGSCQWKLGRKDAEKMIETIKQTKELIERLASLQEQRVTLPCPRCGHYRMNESLAINAKSQKANVYICDTCSIEETLLDEAGKEPLPLSEWALAILLNT